MITVTPKAAEKVLALAQKEGKGPLMRIGVRGGGCTGLSYFMDFVEEIRDTDTALTIGDLTVICDPKSLEVIDGTKLDYDNNLLSTGFKFINPKAKQSCGCGESFSV